MEKYQKAFLNKISRTMERWQNKQDITNDELYRFLHSMEGTAGTIGLAYLTEEAEKALQYVKEADEHSWKWEDLNQLLSFLKPFLHQEVAPTIEKVEPVKAIEQGGAFILLVENDIDHLLEFKTQLEEKGYSVLAAMTMEKAVSIFHSKKPDCLLIGVGHNVDVSFVNELIEKAKLQLIPSIVVDKEASKQFRLGYYEMGVMDYFEIPMDYEEFFIRLKNRLSYKKALQNAVLIDELTGAFNRRFFNVEINRLMNVLTDQHTKFSLALIDLDHFKKVNDTYGHDVGDVVLRSFSQFIQSRKRTVDTFVRYGGEEFALLMPELVDKDAKEYIDELRNEFKEMKFSGDSQRFSCTFSSGIVSIKDPIQTIDTYIKRADQALYEAKNSGRNTVYLHEENNKTRKQEKILRIGIIDDDEIIHGLLTDYISRISFNEGIELDIQCFREGETFFKSEWCKQQGKYFLLLDGVLPRMDGIEILKKIRSDFPEEDFVVMMVTSRKNERDIVKALEAGADDYLTKPFSMKELEARIKRFSARLLRY